MLTLSMQLILVAQSLVLTTAATSLRMQYHLQGPALAPEDYAKKCVEGFEGNTLVEKCEAMVAYVQRDGWMNATNATKTNSTDMVAKKKEETCAEINAKLKELEEQKKRCETPDGVP